jgi:hypothetical protein
MPPPGHVYTRIVSFLTQLFLGVFPLSLVFYSVILDSNPNFPLTAPLHKLKHVDLSLIAI